VRSSILVSGAVAVALSIAPSTARAHGEEEEFPVSFVERPLTLPKFVLAPFGELDITRIGVSANTPIGVVSASQVFAGMQVGASFGITKNFEVGAVVLPIQFNSPAGYGGDFIGEEGPVPGPSLFATFRFFHGEKLDVGARLRLQFIIPRGGLGAGAIVTPSVPLLLHIGKIGRFDAELGLPISFVPIGTRNDLLATSSTQVNIGLDVPLRLAFDIIEPLHVGVNTGVAVDDFSDGGHTTRVPLGVFFGYAVGEKRPIVDIDPFFNFYDFLTPGGGPFGDTVNPGVFAVGVNARGYLYF
jgi:hypothetical protein